MRVINASKFFDYLLCPALYEYKYLQNFKEVLYENNEEAKLGTRIHNLIDAHFKEIPISEDHLDDKKLKEWFDYYLDKHLPVEELETLNEYSFNIPVSTRLEKVVLSGRMDRVVFQGDKVTIIDWKSNSRKTKMSTFISNLQMDFYAYAISKIREFNIIELKLIYLDLKEESVRIINQKDLEIIEKNLFNMIKATNPGIKVYIPKPLLIDNIPVCKVCQFFTLCENLL